jgi:dynein heavy chain
MRAVKSVLVMAGALKRANPELREDIVLIRALRDSSIIIITVLHPELYIDQQRYSQVFIR